MFTMVRKSCRNMIAAALAVCIAACSNHVARQEGELATNDAANEEAPDDWPVYGRSWQANHFSPLDDVDDRNISRLHLAWFTDIDETGSMYTSPIEVAGTLYFVVGISQLWAMDAVTGKVLWRHDAEVGKVAGMKMRYGFGSRGIAYAFGKVYMGTLDGRLIAVDAKTGKTAWSVQTTQGPNDGRYITGAPWIMKDKVIIGHGGADFNPVRGYVTAYDAKTGAKRWRFYTVPGNPAAPPDGEASDAVMPMAAKTWTGEWWKFGGGGTVWNAFAYDKRYNHILVGTGNGAPWNAHIRSPGGGDNLFLASIVALDADTGKYVWHYQINPGETWDFNASMDITLTDIPVDGKMRAVLIHAPKNGFFYVIDRKTGKLISAEKFVRVNWADRIDLKSGRPVEAPNARFDKGGSFLMPGPAGGHNAQPMAFNPMTGLAYISTLDSGYYYTDAGIDVRNWKHSPGRGQGANIGLSQGAPPKSAPQPKANLVAWNIRTQKPVWSVPLPDPPNMNGGVSSTAGNLVMQGQLDGKFNIYAANDGKLLWSFDAQAGISSQPITYRVSGRQYITVLAGFRGGFGASPWDYRAQKRRVLTFSLDGKSQLPPAEPYRKAYATAPGFIVDLTKVAKGESTFTSYTCFVCHGVDLMAGGTAPDLRESAVPADADAFAEVVARGALAERGMPKFGELSQAELEGLRHYIIANARAAQNGQAPTHRSTVTTQ